MRPSDPTRSRSAHDCPSWLGADSERSGTAAPSSSPLNNNVDAASHVPGTSTVSSGSASEIRPVVRRCATAQLDAPPEQRKRPSRNVHEGGDSDADGALALLSGHLDSSFAFDQLPMTIDPRASCVAPAAEIGLETLKGNSCSGQYEPGSGSTSPVPGGGPSQVEPEVPDINTDINPDSDLLLPCSQASGASSRSQHPLQKAGSLLEDVGSIFSIIDTPALTTNLRKKWGVLVGDLEVKVAAMTESKNIPSDDKEVVSEGRLCVYGLPGHGKSRLINELLECPDLLPHAVGASSKTSAAIELRYNYESEGYRVKLDVMTEAEWVDFRVQQAQALYATITAGAPDSAEQRAARDAARCILRPAVPALCARNYSTVPPELQDELYDRDRRCEDPELLRFLRDRDINAEWRPFATLDQVRSFLNEHAGGGSVKSLAVTRVQVEGPFALLQTGMALVDLPGVYDANRQRAELAKKYRESCSHLWLVSRADERFNANPSLQDIKYSIVKKMPYPFAVVLTKTGTEHEDSIESTKEEIVEGFRDTIQDFADEVEHDGGSAEHLKELVASENLRETIPVVPVCSAADASPFAGNLSVLRDMVATWAAKVHQPVSDLETTVCRVIETMLNDLLLSTVATDPHAEYQNLELAQELSQQLETALTFRRDLFVASNIKLIDEFLAMLESRGIQDHVPNWPYLVRGVLSEVHATTAWKLLQKGGGPHHLHRPFKQRELEKWEFVARFITRSRQDIDIMDTLTKSCLFSPALDAAWHDLFENRMKQALEANSAAVLAELNQTLAHARAHFDVSRSHFQPFPALTATFPSGIDSFHSVYAQNALADARKNFVPKFWEHICSQASNRDNPWFDYRDGEGVASAISRCEQRIRQYGEPAARAAFTQLKQRLYGLVDRLSEKYEPQLIATLKSRLERCIAEVAEAASAPPSPELVAQIRQSLGPLAEKFNVTVTRAEP